MTIGEDGLAYLIDTNVLLRWIQQAAPEHLVAVSAVSNLCAKRAHMFIAAQNIIEYWSVATRPVNVNGLGLSPLVAEHDIDQLEQFFVLLPDVPAIYRRWRNLVTNLAVSGRQAHDARLVAVMQAHGVSHLLTFNVAHFMRFPGITVVHPQDVQS